MEALRSIDASDSTRATTHSNIPEVLKRCENLKSRNKSNSLSAHLTRNAM